MIAIVKYLVKGPGENDWGVCKPGAVPVEGVAKLGWFDCEHNNLLCWGDEAEQAHSLTDEGIVGHPDICRIRAREAQLSEEVDRLRGVIVKHVEREAELTRNVDGRQVLLDRANDRLVELSRDLESEEKNTEEIRKHKERIQNDLKDCRRQKREIAEMMKRVLVGSRLQVDVYEAWSMLSQIGFDIPPSIRKTLAERTETGEVIKND